MSAALSNTDAVEMSQAEMDRFFLRMKNDFIYYAPRALKVKPKMGGLMPLKLNFCQEYVHRVAEDQLKRTGMVRLIILKGRQQGMSTYIEARLYWKTTHSFGLKAYILTHEAEATKNLFEMAERYYDNCAVDFKPATDASNAKELSFGELDTKYSVGTAGAKGTGRSQNIHLFHGCLAEGTPVLTPEGRCVPIEQWMVGDKVVTHTGQVAPVSFISSQQKDCYSLELFGTNLPVISSGEHKYLTRDGWRPLSDLQVGDEVAYPVKNITADVTFIPLALPRCPRPQGGGCDEHVARVLEPTYALGRIMGLYLAEGTILRQSSSGMPSAVQFTVHEREVGRTVDWLQSFIGDGFKSVRVQVRPNSLTRVVIAYGKSFATMVEALCGKCDSKQLPASWWAYGEEFVRGLIHGYLAGDGHSSGRKYDRRISAPSIREAITFGMRDALLALGYGWAVIAYRGPAIRSGRNEQAQWTLRLSGAGVDSLVEEIGWTMPARSRVGKQRSTVRDGYVWLPIQSITPVGLRQVYDFEVNHPDHSYCLPQCATHNSEVAYWPHANDHASGVMQAVAEAPGTEIWLESTANGPGDLFHNTWVNATDVGREPQATSNSYIRVFIPWFWQEEYRSALKPGFLLDAEELDYMMTYDLELEQMQWRRNKVLELGNDGDRFRRDYPATPDEAFNNSTVNTLIPTNLVVRARKSRNVEAFGARILGVDVAREGDDRSAIAFRQGRVLHFVNLYTNKDNMELVGLITKAVREYAIQHIFVDGVGNGSGVIDRLRELGFGHMLTPIKGNSVPLDGVLYYNKRAECWGRMKDWFDDEPVQIPDDNELQADLCGLTRTFDSHERMVLERKADAKKRGIKSPDAGDAVAFTFAQPISLSSSGSFEPEEQAA